ncbi:hypothetical protein [Microbacterium sp. EF45047]|uniref:hypothetical protein n=1 Tax=Microbacterium sp. EF45047 TaxID=2809708 RepID=UPI002348FEAF|nr:hypothetical protein [Microbacterium sp. EF45047]WCM55666.1 hypothetical protein JRG78_12300 [Microbacterium sp. EF45047]
MHPQPPAVPFDARPLTEPVDPRAVAEFAREMRRRTPPSTAGVVFTVIAAVFVVAVALPVVGAMTVVLATVLSHGGDLSALAVVPILLLALTIVGGAVFGVLSWRRRREQRYRIARFAAANNMVYEDRIADPQLPGMIFQHGSGRMSTSLVRGFHPRFVEFGNYQYTVKHGKSSTTYHWGYVAVRLDVPLPNIVLDAVGNNTLGSNLPASFSKDQRLSLEGDFDRYFTLYCPRGYEQDALYLFTPDIMARFIDHAAELDVEIVDDWMFLYMRRPVSTTDPATWAWLFGIVGALMTKFDQWARWRDERLRAAQASAPPASTDAGPQPPLPFAPPAGMITPPPPGVAPEGRRLKKSTSWITILVFILMIVGWVWMQFDH